MSNVEVIRLLEVKRAELLAHYEANGFEEIAREIAVEGRDPDQIDRAQVLQDALNRTSVAQRDLIKLEAIALALRRWQESPETAHLCLSEEKCLGDGKIGEGRLRLVPYARFCVRCQERLEKNGRR